MLFNDRQDAGKNLAQDLLGFRNSNPIVFGLPRGGVVVAYEVAKTLNSPLEPLVVRKLGVPGFEELGFGAIALGGVLTIDDSLVDRLGLDHEQISAVKTKEKQELLRRAKEYGAQKDYNLKGKVAILIDDGIATGATMLAGVRFLRKFRPDKVVVAVPVCPTEIEAAIKKEADEFICLQPEPVFGAIGEFYNNFDQISDQEVKDLLNKARKGYK